MMSKKHEFLNKNDLQNLMCLLLDTDGKSLNDMDENEIGNLFEKQLGKYFSLQKSFILDQGDIDQLLTAIKDDTRIQTLPYEKGVRYYLSEDDKEKVLDIVTKVVSDFIENLNKILNLDIKFKIEELYCKSIDELRFNIEQYSPLSYNKLYSQKESSNILFFGSHPSLINNILMENNEPGKDTKIVKQIMNNWVLTPLINIFQKHCPNNVLSSLKESSLEPKNYNTLDFTFNDNILSYLITLEKDNISSPLYIAMSEPLCETFLGKEETFHSSFDEEKHNVFSLLYNTWINEEVIENLKEGQIIIFNKIDNIHSEQSSYPLIINNKLSFVGSNMANKKDTIKDHKDEWGIRGFRTEKSIDDEKDKILIQEIHDSNLFLVYAGTKLTNEQIAEIQEFSDIPFDSHISDLYPLYFNRRLVALCTVGASSKYNVCQIVKVL